MQKNLHLKEIIEDIHNRKFNKYDFAKLKGYENYYRIRKWKIRIVFKIEDWKIEILKIQTRWDVYKSL